MAGELRFPKVNSVTLTGRLTRDAELRYTSGGIAVTKISIAFDNSYQKNGEWVNDTSFINVTAWDKTAEKCAEELQKGSPVLVEGYLKMNSWTDKDNNNRSVIEIISRKISFLEKSGGNSVSVKSQQVTDDDVPFN
jgi:single-strand DNA-binding protein